MRLPLSLNSFWIQEELYLTSAVFQFSILEPTLGRSIIAADLYGILILYLEYISIIQTSEAKALFLSSIFIPLY